MSDRVFLDTNIFVYTFDTKAPAKAATAAALIAEALRTGTGLVSFQVVQEFFNVALSRFTPVFTPDDAQRYFAMVFRPLLAVHSSPAIYHQALEFKSRYNFSWYDSLIVAGAAQAECAKLLTEDLQHGMKIDRLRIENPFLSH